MDQKKIPDILAFQEEIYRKGNHYDYIIMGTGMSALTCGSLLAHTGHRVCLLEAHDSAGGYAHTFSLDGYDFCAQVHYICGCAPGQTIYEFLRFLGLHEKVTFEAFDSQGYDIASLPDGKRVGIPYGFDNLIDHIEAAYPGQRNELKRFVSVISSIRDQIRALPLNVHWSDYLSALFKYPHLLRYKNYTLQDLFNACDLKKEAQAILCAQAGDFGSPPEELSLFAYTALFSGYNEGAYYPTKQFKHLVSTLAKSITDHEGCHIFYKTEVTGIETEKGRVKSVLTRDGKRFQAGKYICNIDPQKIMKMTFGEHIPASYLYQYSPGVFIVYVGLENIDLCEFGFKNANFWHLEQWDMNKIWKEQMNGNFEKPWIFISSPSLRSPDRSDAPPGGQTLVFGSLAPYDYFKQKTELGYEIYAQEKQKICDHMLQIIEKNFVPSIRKYIKVMAVGTPLTNEQFCFSPFGNCYGSVLTPQNMGLQRVNPYSPWENLYWCNASRGYPGISGTVSTGIRLYEKLTGDQTFSKVILPSPESSIAFAKNREYKPVIQNK